MQWPGFFVALEGIDGAGTTSQLAPLAARLTARGHAVHVTCEPSKQPPGQLARRYLAAATADVADEATLALLFAADRLAHVQHEVLPALQAGAVVLCDRYLLSSYAYQTTGPQALSLPWVQALNAQAPAADLTLFFAVTPDVAKARRQARGRPAERFDADARQARVAAAYADLAGHPATAAALGAVEVVAADAPLAQVTDQADALLAAALARRGLPAHNNA